MKRNGFTIGEAAVALADLEAFYRDAKQRFDSEPGFADRARDYVVRLQSGDPHCLALWEEFREISIRHSEALYARLNVTLTRTDIRAESAYNDALVGIVARLQEQGLAVEDQGAQVVFPDGFTDRDGQPQPVIVQKSGGGYLYATSDLATAFAREGHPVLPAGHDVAEVALGVVVVDRDPSVIEVSR